MSSLLAGLWLDKAFQQKWTRTFTFELSRCVDRLTCKRSVLFTLLLFLCSYTAYVNKAICTTFYMSTLTRLVVHVVHVGLNRSEEHTSELQSHLNLVCRR